MSTRRIKRRGRGKKRTYRRKCAGGKKYFMRGCSMKRRGGSYALSPSPVERSFDSHPYPSTQNGGEKDARLYPNVGPTGPYPGQLNGRLGHNGGTRTQHGGYNGLPFGQNLPPMKAPAVFNDFVGKPWSASNYGSNYFAMNKYVPDVVTAIKDVGANFPFLGGGRRKHRGGAEAFPMITDFKSGLSYTSYLSDVASNSLAGNSVKLMDPRPYIQPHLSPLGK